MRSFVAAAELPRHLVLLGTVDQQHLQPLAAVAEAAVEAVAEPLVAVW